jgi:hypothetical protein
MSNQQLFVTFLLHVSTSTRPLSDKSSKCCQGCAHLWQKLLCLYTFVYSSLMTTLWRSKHIGGTKVTNYYLLFICNLLDQVVYISFLIFRSYFLTTYSGRIRFADATSLFCSTCYAREVICKFCGWSGNRWRAGGGRDPCPVTPWSLLFLWELENFSTLSVSLRSSRAEFLRGGNVRMTARAGRSLSGHILVGSVSALPVYYLFYFSILDWLPYSLHLV